MNFSTRLLCVLLSLFMVTSCRIFKRNKKNDVVATTTTVNYDDKKSVLKAIDSTRVQFTYLSYDASTKLGGDLGDFNVDISFKMKRGEVIWASVTAMLGIEAARILITQDSVHIMNKLQKEYCVYELSYLESILGRKVTISELQDILIGNSIFKKDSNAAFQPTETEVIFNFTELGFQVKEGFFKTLLRPSTVNADNRMQGRTVNMNYESYKVVEGKNFPDKIKINVDNAGQKLTAQMSNSGFHFEPITSFPFRVPSGYDCKN